MPEQIEFLATFLWVFVGLVFMLVGWIYFCLLRLNPSKANKATGVLTGFRAYRADSGTSQFSPTHDDHDDNKSGRRPVLLVRIDGKLVEISSDWPDYDLTTQDIGRKLPVLWQRKLGISLLVDKEKAIHDYLQFNNILFGVFMGIGALLIAVGLIVPRVL